MVSAYRFNEEQALYEGWGKLTKLTFDTTDEKGKSREHQNELYNTGNGVAVLLYNSKKKTVLLIRQFRVATVRNGNPEGLNIEVCAGKVDDLSADETIIKEIWEETGYRVNGALQIMSVYPSPGAYTERLELYIAEYQDEDRKGEGGGLKDEGEDIEVMELPFDEALSMVHKGIIRDCKTIILLQYAAINNLFEK
jgi:nudix-type nucleoside diphosphatase (YffH/AdpP family)